MKTDIIKIFCVALCIILLMPNKSADPIDFSLRTQRFCSEDARLAKSSGLSMFPYTNDGDIFYIDNVSFGDIEIGDVIVFSKNGNVIHHAVIDRYPGKLRTAGYNNNEPDAFIVYPKDIIGRECFKR